MNDQGWGRTPHLEYMMNPCAIPRLYHLTVFFKITSLLLRLFLGLCMLGGCLFGGTGDLEGVRFLFVLSTIKNF